MSIPLESPLQVENCDSNSRLVVDEDDNGKLLLERVKEAFLSFCKVAVTIFKYQCDYIV